MRMVLEVVVGGAVVEAFGGGGNSGSRCAGEGLEAVGFGVGYIDGGWLVVDGGG